MGTFEQRAKGVSAQAQWETGAGGEGTAGAKALRQEHAWAFKEEQRLVTVRLGRARGKGGTEGDQGRGQQNSSGQRCAHGWWLCGRDDVSPTRKNASGLGPRSLPCLEQQQAQSRRSITWLLSE